MDALIAHGSEAGGGSCTTVGALSPIQQVVDQVEKSVQVPAAVELLMGVFLVALLV